MKKNILKSAEGFADQMLDAVFLVDIDGRIKYVNAACKIIFDYTPDEMIGRFIVDFVAPGDRDKTLQEAGRVIAGEQRVGFENRYLRKDGREVHVMWSARWLASERLRIGVARDITQQRQSKALSHDLSAVDPSSPLNEATKTGHAKPQPATSEDLLTGRQLEVLVLLSRGLTYIEIADMLGLKSSTVATHVKAIYERLGVKNKAEALFEGRALGLLG